MQDLRDIAATNADIESNGFNVWDTGGGCTAYGKNMGPHYVLITSACGAETPEENESDLIIGIHNAETGDFFECDMHRENIGPVIQANNATDFLSEIFRSWADSNVPDLEPMDATEMLFVVTDKSQQDFLQRFIAAWDFFTNVNK